MSYFVFYHDDSDETEGIGLKAFGAAQEALEYIAFRLAEYPERRNLSDYTLIEGTTLPLKLKET